MWINNSADALRRRAIIEKRDRMDKIYEQQEQKIIQSQITRAQHDAALRTSNARKPGEVVPNQNEIEAFKVPPAGAADEQCTSEA